ncbi:alpha/beta hydrolase [Pseudomonas sp. N40(2020)]|uniref:alpha/beta hydrolase n=1 Tax=Pseudomonas sp. N40(2020) TaxID=2767798 RepID=UPI001656CB02|nr:alpha/beta hydrolase [Pseudomonas sp. N40(2020)]MBC8997057.1 alpha/beta hydrolase [Pseudomonas sp. N40(2020)]
MAGFFRQGFGAMIGAVVLLLLSACSPVKLLNALTPDSTFEKTTGIAYGDDPRQKLDVYVPRHALADAPVVVFFYGGSWNSGAREDYAFVGEALASRGIVAVVADYRLYPQVRYPLFLEDNARAVAWTRAHIREFSGNPQRLYLMGHSSGGYNAAMLALDGDLLAAVGMSPKDISGWIGLAGPYDFLPIVNPDVRPVFFWPHSPPQSQPINHVNRGAPPALLIAASKDNLVNPTRNTGGLAHKLREAGVPVQDLYYSRPNHITLVATLSRPLRRLAPVLDQVVGFIEHTPAQ